MIKTLFFCSYIINTNDSPCTDIEHRNASHLKLLLHIHHTCMYTHKTNLIKLKA